MKFRNGGGRTLVALLSAMLLVYAFAGVVTAEHGEAGPAVTPTAGVFPGGQPSCPDGEGIRFGDDADDDAPLSDGASAGGVTIDLNASGTTVDFSTDGTVLVAHVFVKGGTANGQNHYNYIDSTIDSVAHDDGLTTPTGQQISHIDFCLVDAPDPTPVPTDEPTPTPTDEPTPTPTDEPTPTPTDEPTPTPTDEPTPTPTNEPTPDPTDDTRYAGILFFKVIDEDGDIDTDDDWTWAADWQFNLDLASGAIEESQSVTDRDGFGYFFVSFEGESVNVLLSEQLKGGYSFVDAVCFAEDLGETQLRRGFSRAQSMVEAQSHWGFDIGEIEGTGVRFDAEADELSVCAFFNTLNPSATQPPESTPPTPAPTDEPKPALTPPPTSVAPVSGASQPSMTLVLLLVGLSAAAWLLLRPVSLTPVRQRIDRDGR